LERHYKDLARTLLNIYIKEFGTKDSPDPDKVFTKQQKLMDKKYREFYNLVLASVDSQFLEIWNNEVASEFLEIYLKGRSKQD
jgi:hypothetical protein